MGASIGKVGAKNLNYHLEVTADSAYEYFTGSGEAQGAWIGSACGDLELDGVVAGEAYRAVMTGHDPTTGELLKRTFSRRKTFGFDVTFSVPKSVSLLAYAGDDEVYAHVREAIDISVRDGLAYLEDNAAWGRRGAQGADHVRATGFIASEFFHRASREEDPQLHTHVVVANAVRFEDGSWSSLDSLRLYRHIETAGYVQEARLRYELTRRLGVEWHPIGKATCELKGFDRSVIDQFSKRSKQIEDELQDALFDDRAARQRAALKTRKKKVSDPNAEDRDIRWRRELKEFGIDQKYIDSIKDQARVPRLSEAQVERAIENVMGQAGLTRENATFAKRHVIKALCHELPMGTDPRKIDEIADRALEDRGVIVSSDVEHQEALDIDIFDSILIADRYGQTLYTTPEILALEQRCVEYARSVVGASMAVVDPEAIARVVEEHAPFLGEDQRAALQRIVTSGSGVDVIVGRAGTGKSTMLRPARVLWQQHGHTVVGCATSAKAAAELSRNAGIDSFSIEKLIYDCEQYGVEHVVPAGSVVVLDEAAMTSTRDFGRLMDLAQRTGSKLVICGDDHQIAAVEQGGLFRALQQRLGFCELVENRRQKHAVDRAVAEQIRSGRSDQAHELMVANDRWHVSSTPEAVRAHMIERFTRYTLADESTLLLAYEHRDVYPLNLQAQLVFATQGRLDNSARVETPFYDFHVGDRVLLKKNISRLNVRNGNFATVVAVDLERQTLSVTIDDQEGVVELPASYVRDPDRLRLGYASSIYSAQGTTVDRSLVLGSSQLNREEGYSALTRGRLSNELFLCSPEPIVTESFGSDEIEDPDEHQERVLRKRSAKIAAVDVGRADPFADQDDVELARELTRIQKRIDNAPDTHSEDKHRLRDRREELVVEIARCDKWIERAQQRLFDAGAAGDHASTYALGEASSRKDAFTKELEQIDQELTQLRRESRKYERWMHVNAGLFGERDRIQIELSRRVDLRVRAYAECTPQYIVDAIGPAPDSPIARQQWSLAAAKIEVYRYQQEVTDPKRAFGPVPADAELARERRSAIAETKRIVSRAQRVPQRFIGTPL